MGRKKTIKTIDEVLENSKTDQQPQEENLVKKTCRELGITQKELAERIGLNPRTISVWGGGKIEQSGQVLLQALIDQSRFYKIIDLISLNSLINRV